MNIKKCAFTGHRPQSLPFGFNEAAVYGAQRSPFRFRAAAFRSKTAAHFN